MLENQKLLLSTSLHLFQGFEKYVKKHDLGIEHILFSNINHKKVVQIFGFKAMISTSSDRPRFVLDFLYMLLLLSTTICYY